MAIDWNNVGYPGTRVFDGMAAAAQAGQAMSADTMAWMQKRDHRANQPVRDLQRQLQTNEMQTALPIAQEANKVLLGINKHSKGMDTPQGFVDYLNTERPDPAGGKYKLAKDASGKQKIDLIGVDGGLLHTMPAYSGDSARRWAVRSGGENLMTMRGQLRDLDYREGTIAANIAGGEQRMEMALMKMQMQQQMQEARLMSALAGGAGGKKGKGDDQDQDIRDLTYLNKMEEAAESAAMRELGIHKSSDGIYVDRKGQELSDNMYNDFVSKRDTIKDNLAQNWRGGQLSPYALNNAIQNSRPAPLAPGDLRIPDMPAISGMQGMPMIPSGGMMPGAGAIAGGLGLNPFTGQPDVPQEVPQAQQDPGYWNRDIYTIGRDMWDKSRQIQTVPSLPGYF